MTGFEVPTMDLDPWGPRDESLQSDDPDHRDETPPTLAESGLARSIRALFEDEATAEAPALEAGSAPEAGPGVEPARTPDSPPALEPGPAHAEDRGATRGDAATRDPTPATDERAELSPPASARGSIRDAFTTRVARYLTGTPGERDRLVGEILEEGRRLRGAQEIRAVSDAAVSLALHGDDHDDRAAVGLALELMDSAVTSHLAVRLAMEPDSRSRDALSRVAALFPGMFAPALADALPDAPDRTSRRAFMDALSGLGDEGREAVVHLLEDPRWYAVRDGIQLLAEMSGRDAVQDLTSVLAHDDPRLRRETLRALAGIGGEAAGLLILGMLDDPDPHVRAAAAEGAGNLRLARAQRPLAELLESETEDDVVVAAIGALGRIRDPASVSIIEKRAGGSLFSRPDRMVRLAAYRALAEIGTPAARRVLEAAASDRDREIRRAVKELLDIPTRDVESAATSSYDLEDGP